MLYFDHERLLKWPADSQEHFMPLHACDLVEFLVQHPGLDEQFSQRFRQFANLILSMQHHLYRQQHSQMLYGYAPLDPDLDRMLASVPTDSQRVRLASQLPSPKSRRNRGIASAFKRVGRSNASPIRTSRLVGCLRSRLGDRLSLSTQLAQLLSKDIGRSSCLHKVGRYLSAQ